MEYSVFPNAKLAMIGRENCLKSTRRKIVVYSVVRHNRENPDLTLRKTRRRSIGATEGREVDGVRS